MIAIEELQGSLSQLEFLLLRIIGIAHSTCCYDAFFLFGAQLRLDKAGAICLGTDGIEIRNSIAGRTAITINTPMGAAAVNIHSIIGTKPGIAAGSCDDVFDI